MINRRLPFGASGGSETAMRDDPYNNDPFINETDQSEASQRRGVVLALLRGRWHWAILLAVLLGVAGGYLGFNSQPDMYQARSFIILKPDYSRDTPIDVKELEDDKYINFVNDEIRRLTSVDVITAAMGKPAWTKHLENRPAKLPEVTLDSFASQIDVSEPGKNEEVLYVFFEDQNPATASAALNALLDAYREKQTDNRNEKLTYSIQVLTDQIKDLEKKKLDKQKEIADILKNENVESVRQRQARFNGMLTQLQFRLNNIDRVVEPFRKLRDGAAGDTRTRRDMMMQDPEWQRLQQEMRSIELWLEDAALRGWGPEMREVKKANLALTQLSRKIVEFETAYLQAPTEENPQPQQFPQEILSLMAERDIVSEQIHEHELAINDTADKLSKITELERELRLISDSVLATKTERDGYQKSLDYLLEQSGVSRIEINPVAVEAPTMPYNAGKRRQLAGVGAIGGFVVGFGLVMMVGVFDRRLRHVSDTAAGLPDTNVLGILPTLPADLKSPEEAETAAHCVHHIRTLLQIGGSNRVFSITSPAAGSGKSSLATALGMSFAASGVRTLVIDCDLVGAGLSRRMGTVVHEPLDVVLRKNRMIDEAELARALTLATSHNKPLEQVLIDEGLLDEEQVETAVRLQRDTALGVLNACAPNRLRACVAATGVENFFVLPVGKAKPSDASRLSPAAMRELIRQAREAFDIVLIDTGPVLGSLEASIAAAEADATVLIVSRGDQKSLAARTLTQLRSVRANIAGVVFNHALESDLEHTSYASVISQERRPDRVARRQRLDQTRSARLGPLGTAVASFTDEESANHGEGAYTNGKHNGQGHDA